MDEKEIVQELRRREELRETSKLQKENRKLKEKLRKAEALAKQAECDLEQANGINLALQWGIIRMLHAEGNGKARNLIGWLIDCHKFETKKNSRLRRKIERLERERDALLGMAADKCSICANEGECDYSEGCRFEWDGKNSD